MFLRSISNLSENKTIDLAFCFDAKLKRRPKRRSSSLVRTKTTVTVSEVLMQHATSFNPRVHDTDISGNYDNNIITETYIIRLQLKAKHVTNHCDISMLCTPVHSAQCSSFYARKEFVVSSSSRIDKKYNETSMMMYQEHL